MKLRTVGLTSLMMVLAFSLSAAALQNSTDPLSGSWVGDWGPSANDRNAVTVELKWDGTALSGTVNPGPNAVELQKSTFDAKTGAVHMEADAKNYKGEAVHFVIDGKVKADKMSGKWNHGGSKGDFKIAKK